MAWMAEVGILALAFVLSVLVSGARGRLAIRCVGLTRGMSGCLIAVAGSAGLSQRRFKSHAVRL